MLVVYPLSILSLLLVLHDQATTRPTPTSLLAGDAIVIDGDTLEIRGQRVRLLGIDAPESKQTCVRPDGESWLCGKDAASALSNKINKETVSCATDNNRLDRYSRVIAVCRLINSGEDLNSWMVRQGWALAYRQYSKSYIADELTAKTEHRGIWSSVFTAPWDWRKRRHRPIAE